MKCQGRCWKVNFKLESDGSEGEKYANVWGKSILGRVISSWKALSQECTWLGHRIAKEVSEAAKEVMRMVEMKLENYSVEGVDARRSYKALVYSKNFNIFLWDKCVTKESVPTEQSYALLHIPVSLAGGSCHVPSSEQKRCLSLPGQASNGHYASFISLCSPTIVLQIPLFQMKRNRTIWSSSDLTWMKHKGLLP